MELFATALQRMGSTINHLIAPLHLEVRRRREPVYLRQLAVKTVLDIGANTGQFARSARLLLPEATIHSFEPLPRAIQALLEHSEAERNHFVYPVALGETDGEAEMLEHEFSPSSSMLKMAAAHVRAFPGTERSHPVPVRMIRLDDWAADQLLPEAILIKIDVQGYEDRVLRGGEQTIRRASLVILEVSFLELYHGQALFDELHSLVLDLGFRCIGLENVVRDRRSGQTLQADAVFAPQRTHA